MSTDSQQQVLAAAERLLKPRDVLAAAPALGGGSLAQGLAGTALLHARLSATDPVFASAARTHWTEAATQMRSVGEVRAGLYDGPGGLAASLIIGVPYLPDPNSHRVAAMRAARWTSVRAVELAEHYREYLNSGGTGAPWHMYDAISGLSGIGRVLLAAVDSGHRVAEPGLLAALSTLTSMIRSRHGKRPGWWLATDHLPSGMPLHPSGAANTGMAHGIAGPLALLALARIAGWTVAGQEAAIEEAAYWLLRWRTNATPAWPPYVTGDELDTGIASPVRGRGDAWCYGIAGISGSLTLAGRAVDDHRLTDAADAALCALAERSIDQWDVEGPTLCHGYAGVLRSAAAGHDQAASGRSQIIEHAASAIAASFRAAVTPSDKWLVILPGPGVSRAFPGSVGVNCQS